MKKGTTINVLIDENYRSDFMKEFRMRNKQVIQYVARRLFFFIIYISFIPELPLTQIIEKH